MKSHLVMSGGANFEGNVNLASATVGGVLSTEGSSFKGDVNLASAAVGSNLSMIGASFKKGVNMDSLEVKSSLFMRGGANFDGDVNLRFAKVAATWILAERRSTMMLI